MGEIANQVQAPNGSRRVKRLSTRVDLTPMVDLGFLLITFFVFTSAMSRPTALQLNNPKDDGSTRTKYPASTVLTAIPISNNNVFYYHGKLDEAIAAKQYGVAPLTLTNGIGDVIRKKQETIGLQSRFTKDDVSVIIKGGDEASYKSLIDMLDEMLINDVKHYMLIDVSSEEIEAMKKLNIR